MGSSHHMETLKNKGARETAASKDAVCSLEKFIEAEGDLYEHVLKGIEAKEALRTNVEIHYFIEAFEHKQEYNAADLRKRMDLIAIRSLGKGKQKAT